MAITDELRHNIEGAEQLYGRKCPCITAMCDRIDEAHKKVMDDSYRDGYESRSPLTVVLALLWAFAAGLHFAGMVLA